MENGTRSIGAMARDSGLSISALRFYDSAGVLRPARVDPVTGYRWYAVEQIVQARLIAALRQVSMPLDDICDVLTTRHDPCAVDHLLDRHLRRLEDSLADARRHLRVARDLLQPERRPVTSLTAAASALAAALAAVRYAASTDPDLPAFNGVLFDYDGNALRLVASDRYRLAVATIASRHQHGPPVRTTAPMPLLNQLNLEFPAGGDVRLALDPRTVTIGADHGPALDAAFPDWERFLRRTPTRQIQITTADLYDRLTTGPTRTIKRTADGIEHDVSVLHVTDDAVHVLDHDHPDAVGFNREFLLEALDAGGTDQLVLTLGDPTEPLAIHRLELFDLVNLLMPTRVT
jgi:DNA-binding transcriptional MerR regulator